VKKRDTPGPFVIFQSVKNRHFPSSGAFLLIPTEFFHTSKLLSVIYCFLKTGILPGKVKTEQGETKNGI